MKRLLAVFFVVVGVCVNIHYVNAAAPTCNGQTATVYVDSGVIVGGPGNGTTYTGTLTASSASVIVGTSGDDTITGSGSADTICAGDGNDTIDGGTGTDTIAFSTNSDTSGITVNVTGSGSGTITTATGSSTFTRSEGFVGTQYNDTFTMGTSGVLTGILNGGSGTDTADYSARSTAVSLNMYTNVFTSISGTVSNIENLTGGSGADTLIGNSSANTLTGNGGNDIIFGGDGADTILGGTGKNILIGGKGADTITTNSSSGGDIDIADETTYSNSTTADATTNLSNLRLEWTSASSYANRVSHIQGTLAGGLNGTSQLKITTLQYDNSADSISANTASIQSWYIVKNSLDTITTAFSGETTTDTSIPLAISSSANPTAAGNDVTFTISSTQTAATGTITVYKDSTSLGTCTLSSGSCTYLATGMTAGSYSMTGVYGGDSSYSASTSNALTQVMSDVTAPTLSEITAVTTPTNDSTPNYTFNTNEAGTITYGGSCSSVTTSASSGNNTITFNTLSDATYSNCTITVTDSSSNASSALTVTSFRVDATAPTLAEVTVVTTPTNDNTPNYTFSSTEAGTITYGGSCSSATTSATSGNNTITLSTLADGTYTTCTIRVTDSVSNISTALTITTFRVDTTAPTLSEITAVTTPTNDSTPNYTFNTNEAGTITYGGSCSSATTSATSGNNTVTFNTLADNTYSTCTIRVTDSTTNISSALTVTSFRIDTTAPTLSEITAITSPTTNTTPSYTFSSTEAGTITYGGSCSSYTTSASSGNTTVTFNTLALGTYSTCTIQVTDTANNASSALTITAFTITAPASPSSDGGSSDNGGGGGSSASVPISFVHITPPLPPKNSTAITNHGFFIKVSDPDQVKKVTLRILGKVFSLIKKNGTATYGIVIKTATKIAVAPYVLTIDYGSYNIKQFGNLRLFAQNKPTPNLSLLLSINSLYRTTYQRNPTYSEWLYWANRINHGDKKTVTELLGAMNWQKIHSKK
jgi:hypothetical protein